jgi:hypothetical protein
MLEKVRNINKMLENISKMLEYISKITYINRSTARRLLGSFDRSVREVVEHVSPEGPVGALASWVRQCRRWGTACKGILVASGTPRPIKRMPLRGTCDIEEAQQSAVTEHHWPTKGFAALMRETRLAYQFTHPKAKHAQNRGIKLAKRDNMRMSTGHIGLMPVLRP